MADFEIHTTETVHGVYTVEADSPEEARRRFGYHSSVLDDDAVEQRQYEAFDVQIDKVEEVTDE